MLLEVAIIYKPNRYWNYQSFVSTISLTFSTLLWDLLSLTLPIQFCSEFTVVSIYGSISNVLTSKLSHHFLILPVFIDLILGSLFYFFLNLVKYPKSIVILQVYQMLSDRVQTLSRNLYQSKLINTLHHIFHKTFVKFHFSWSCF